MMCCLHSVLCSTQCYSYTSHCYCQSWCCLISMYLDWTCTPADITWNTYGLSVILTWKVLRNLKLVILKHVSMTWTIYTLTCKHCMICQFDNYLHLFTYIAQCINVSILWIFYLYELCKCRVAMYCATTVTFFT